MADVSPHIASLMRDAQALGLLPREILEVVQNHTATTILQAISQAALDPHLTDRLFAHFEDLFPDICARWIIGSSKGGKKGPVVAAFARILPFAPYLSVFLERFLHEGQHSSGHTKRLTPAHLDSWSSAPNDPISLQRILLSLWRLNSVDQRTYGPLVSPSDLQSLFKHENRAVRYLAIRIFCQLTHASDFKLEALVQEHIGASDAVPGDFDGQQIDYGFLSLHEHGRVGVLDGLRRQRLEVDTLDVAPIVPQALTPLVASYGKAMLPKPAGPSNKNSSVVITSTVSDNLENLARLLQKPGAILLHGLPGSGKTSVIHKLAKDLGTDGDMVTLHLNDQTDAKMLIGLYTTGSKPGSFEWRPGVLTKAVKEGRWVLIEDLDRAPAEVISSLLPLVERGELLIPSRSERIQATSGFRLFATVRTSRGMDGQETLPHLLGLRFWQQLGIKTLPELELKEVIDGAFPLLGKLVPQILNVYRRLSHMSSQPSMAASSRGLVRQLTLRELLKWSRRLQDLLVASASASVISEETRERMFMEAIDCFVGHLPESKARDDLIFAIGEEMHMPRTWVEHQMTGYVPVLKNTETHFTIGRVSIEKRKNPTLSRSKRPFADTTQAKRLLEQLTRSVRLREPVLLVGETGIGKTTVVQQLADIVGRKVIAVNLSQQSEVGDLLGGFKPVSAMSLAMPLKDEFEDLFRDTGLARKNQPFLTKLSEVFAKRKWSNVAKLWRAGVTVFRQALQEQQKRSPEGGEPPAKKQSSTSRLGQLIDLIPRWDEFEKKLGQFNIQISNNTSAFTFAFVEGNIVKAARNGDWVLLDEINLATSDTLESIADLLTDPGETPSILLSETGEIERVKAHPNFRIFGAMNPATDVGKRDLPVGIRSRFTEIYVNSPDRDYKDLLKVVKAYLQIKSSKDEQSADDITRLYMNTKRLADEKRLVDGANEVPHFSLRTLTRVLSYAKEVAPFYGLRRALYEGFSMGFLTLLNRESEEMLVPLIYHHLFGDDKARVSLLSQTPKIPDDGRRYVRFKSKSQDRQYWLLQGEDEPVENENYIISPSVERNLLNVVRATSNTRDGGFPVLIQGPTSAGKTSMIEYLANYSGNRFVRINNHEHTDLQQYLGTYVSGNDGKLQFQEGLLVQAMRKGYWIVLDELNLAPTDVLEALNRLLDDNRELLIPETQEIVRPHENFRLFATQNPAGLYGGRKVLSRAFRNRFLELHFDDIPEDELEFILQKRSRLTSPSDCKRIVTVYKELSALRQSTRVFEQKNSFATLRDLFRWALRDASTREEIAANGFMLLAERVRDEPERIAVKEIIEKVFKVKINPDDLYAHATPPAEYMDANKHGVVWTKSMRRLWMLLSQAVRNREPVLLVGETGCGKTTVCQILADVMGKELHIVNAHQNTETGDIIGSQRPIRNRVSVVSALQSACQRALGQLGEETTGSPEEVQARLRQLPADKLSAIPDDLKEEINELEIRSKALFEWRDGSLVEAMKGGDFFLLDEISLADDSVLERLNSVLEPHCFLLLAEKGGEKAQVEAAGGFNFFATMNPGGDFGKKELSPALRNRFTEIWVPPLSGTDDVLEIVSRKLDGEVKNMANVIVDFASWYGETFRSTASTAFSIRELLVWVQFVNQCRHMDRLFSAVNGAATVFIDGLGADPSGLIPLDSQGVAEQRINCLNKLSELLGADIHSIYSTSPEMTHDESSLAIGGFVIPRIPADVDEKEFSFFRPPTTRLNTFRVVRALQMHKPILLEGSPGVGKTTLVAALAQVCGRPLTRINLSDQTDLMDLFGTDVPVDGAEAGNFAWRDAPFLRAMQRGEWVLLDEMNLASQSVLEGLNACLDHRGEVYISELGQTFKRHPDFRLFAAQNPHHQGGGRKGLPSSFVNRFIVVYADVFSNEDLRLIASRKSPDIPPETIQKLIDFITQLDQKIARERSFGAQGAPWEFNLRDLLRWLHLLGSSDPLLGTAGVDDLLDVVIRQRFRTEKDRIEVTKLYTDIFGRPPKQHSLYHDINSSSSQVGLAMLPRNLLSQPVPLHNIDLKYRLAEIETLMLCVTQNTPCILSGPSGSGKSILVQHLAALAGKELVTFPLNADVDTMDLVGGFEQSDPLREVNSVLQELRKTLRASVLSVVPHAAPKEALQLLYILETSLDSPEPSTLLPATEALLALVSPSSEVGLVLAKAAETLRKPMVVTNPRFEWLDGVIIKALQGGQWLVLDNANLCSASVLDRLNSLLEPDGFISVNEHCDTDGEPRIVRPHPEFRIFLTTDPRYGELSRAMRNRAVEVHLHEPMKEPASHLKWVAAVESSLWRYKTLLSMAHARVSDRDEASAQLALEGLTKADIHLLPRFINDLQTGCLQGSQGVKRESERLVEFLRSNSTDELKSAISGMYSSLQGAGTEIIGDVQPIFPLKNLPVTTLIMRTMGSQPLWLAACFGYYQELQLLDAEIRSQSTSAKNSKLASLNRLQRSFVSERVTAVAKDSTVGVADFMSVAIGLVDSFLRGEAPSDWESRHRFLRSIIHYLWRTLRLVTGPNVSFDEAVFQAHLTQGRSFLKSAEAQEGDLAMQKWVPSFLQKLDSHFSAGFSLKTGLEMEMVWRTFRSDPMPNALVLERSAEVVALAKRFDTLKWKTRSSTISDLAKAMSTLSAAYGIIRPGKVDAQELVKDLSAEIDGLETRIGLESVDIIPFLAAEFQSLRQILMLQSVKLGDKPANDEDVVILSNAPTMAQLRLQDAHGSAQLLQLVDYLTCQDVENFAWKGRLLPSLLSRADKIASTTLNSLSLLEKELPKMAALVSRKSPAVTGSAFADLNSILHQLVTRFLSSIEPGLGDKMADLDAKLHQVLANKSFKFEDRSTWCPAGLLRLLPPMASHVLEVVKDHFVLAWCALRASAVATSGANRYAAMAWVQFSVGALRLYVPNRVFDPHLRLTLETESYKDLKSNLLEKLSSLVDFESRFTGQTSNLRIDLLEQEISQLVQPPAGDVAVYRPPRSQLSQIHAEFNNVLKATVYSEVATSSLQDLSEEAMYLVTENVSRIIDRLSGNFEAYQDMTRPVVNLLRSLQVGLSLINETGTLSSATSELLAVTPFLGGNMASRQSNPIPHKTLEYIDSVTVSSAIDGIDNFTAVEREAVFACFHAFYNEWTEKLEAERKEEQEAHSLYRFRGSFEDEEEINEEEFAEMFPLFDGEGDENNKPSVKKYRVRDMSIRVAEAHKRLLVSAPEPSSALRSTLLSVGRILATELSTQSVVDQNLSNRLLPSVMTILNEKLADLTTESTPSRYNFYTDQNLHEARQLVHLVNSINARFRELQLDDEIGHLQPLADVRAACEKVLEIVHTEPLAKILPKVEHLHAMVYEWQFAGWAPKTHTAPELYTRLTDTIVRWRRVELTTWSRIFAMEEQKCQDDANAWWFVAYQATIAIPMSIVQEGGDVEAYAAKLVGDLETYFTTAILGQFSVRLGLLRQFYKHLDLLVKDYAALSSVYNAVGSFISMYQRYQKVVDEEIARGRLPVEKKMKDVLLMASWKDTNINALRDSARKSHLKLFRVVKKFRQVLGRPLKLIIEKGLPDVEQPGITSETDMARASIDNETVALASKEMLEWLDRCKPLVNVGKTVSIMTKVGRVPKTIPQAVEEVEAFILSLTTSAEELKKETPGVLTEENKDEVKHLKARKRKLFAEVLRQAREMGFEYNIDTKRLARQESPAVILPLCAPLFALGSSCADSAEYFFHKFIDMMPAIRLTANTHSEDLTGRETARSIGYLEGILSVALKQRSTLAKSRPLLDVEEMVSQLRNLTAKDMNGQIAAKDKETNFPRALKWLIEVLRHAIQLVDIHGKLGRVDNSLCQGRLRTWLQELEDLSHKERALGALPPGLTSRGRVDLDGVVAERLRSFDQDVRGMMAEFDTVAFILAELLNWTDVTVDETGARDSIELLDFSTGVTTLSKKILQAVAEFKNESDAQENVSHVGCSNSLDSMVKKLRLDLISRYLKECITKIQTVDLANAEVNRSVTALMAMFVPIAEQYAIICRQGYTRLLGLHLSTVQLAYCLGKFYAHLAAQGFCTPQEKSDEKSNGAGNLESGTGLGDGEGAEDISKDIQPDEDMTELAQEPNEKKDEEIEDEKDAVDMADEDLEGEMGSVAGEDEEGEGDKDGEDEEKDEMDEESGDVDDLDATAQDEKMWDGDGEEAEKDQKGDKPKGEKQDDQVAAEAPKDTDDKDDKDNKDDGDEDVEAAEEQEPEDEAEDVKGQKDVEQQDQNVDETDALELPDDMDLDFGDDQKDGSDDDLDDLDDLGVMDEMKDDGDDGSVQEESGGEEETTEETKPTDGDAGEADEAEAEETEEDGNVVDDEAQIPDEEKADDAEEEDKGEGEKDKLQQPTADPVDTDPQDVAPSDVRSGGQEDETEDKMDLDEDFRNESTRQEEGASGEGSDNQTAEAGASGKLSQPQEQEQQKKDQEQQEQQDADDAEASRAEPFRKLGDALEKWHRQQKEIKEPGEEKNEKGSEEMQQQEFQHLQDDDAAPDTQAIGGATEDEVQPIDDSMAIDEENPDPESNVVQETEEVEEQDVKVESGEQTEDHDVQNAMETEDDGRSGVKTRQGGQQRSPSPEPTLDSAEETKLDEDQKEEIEETSTQLSATHLNDTPLRPYADALHDWVTYQTKTQALSQSLTSQLRLILTPSQSTKLSGSFRTGKRLNIKRIIPYIASSYKRDKIWMRRAIPTKRTYQILLCLDDSKSMAESHSGALALESLVMVARSLTTLEAGQVGVLGFGEHVFEAHDLSAPFSSHDAGARALQKFTFSQDKTDVANLISQTTSLFRAARLTSSSSASSDLWQLSLILSDGLTQSSTHDNIRRLLRESLQERIITVFIVLDDPSKRKSESVLNLKEARFVKDEDGNSRVVIERYLDTFPFAYYLVVHELADLPFALAGLLRTWFAEVNA
ncbi:related to midasin (AAA ATPase) [Cephalotrichum gorgonifer]|uniref:Midasin n=1 Tax=Cephalotrichum gorgonifer TaxID=2041049 RepID=A0AAE8SU14_9PEZI|nr:related to midasin (AAA ATPase) [Cephalotrichum gorgonifer]